LQRTCTVTSDADPELDLVAVAEHLADNGERLHVGQVRTWRRYCWRGVATPSRSSNFTHG